MTNPDRILAYERQEFFCKVPDKLDNYNQTINRKSRGYAEAHPGIARSFHDDVAGNFWVQRINLTRSGFEKSLTGTPARNASLQTVVQPGAAGNRQPAVSGTLRRLPQGGCLRYTKLEGDRCCGPSASPTAEWHSPYLAPFAFSFAKSRRAGWCAAWRHNAGLW